MTGTSTEAENERHREKAGKHTAAREKIMATKIAMVARSKLPSIEATIA